jgi:D-3-phosphoglycerate dehydrogenase
MPGRPEANDATVKVLLTDHPWPDLSVEESVFNEPKFTLISGAAVAGTAEDIERLVLQHNPRAILTCWAPVSEKAISAPSDLAVVSRLGVGIDNIAVEAATARGTWVTNVPDYCVSEVSDHAIGMLLAHTRGIARLSSEVKTNGWRTDGSELSRMPDLTVAVLGYGRIGRETARKLTAFGCRVITYSVPAPVAQAPITAVDLARIQADADVIILHIPLTPESAKMIDARFLASCRKQPLLINVSRGGLVDNAALLAALQSGQVRGAALDVVDGEPSPPMDLLRHRNVVVTPHVAYASTAALIELRRRACEEVVRVINGDVPVCPCNTPHLDRPLDGGVASDIRVTNGSHGPEVIKRALPKLKVAAEWYSDPARSDTEVAAIRAAAELIGACNVPQILWAKPDEHTFAMRLVEARLSNWKAQLLAGRVDVRTAARAGELLGQLHSRSAMRSDIGWQFKDTTYFEELRIEPFFTRVADRSVELGPQIRSIAAGMQSRRSALVHGDYSPKNILADGPDIVILDFEVAHWGDPRFDVGFCLSHLILKAQRRGAMKTPMLDAMNHFISAYKTTGLSIFDQHLEQIAGCLVLARLDGASPVDYLSDIDLASTRAAASSMITGQGKSIETLFPGISF